MSYAESQARITNYLSLIVDTLSSSIETKSTKIDHLPVLPQKGIKFLFCSFKPTNYLSRFIDVTSQTADTTKITEVSPLTVFPHVGIICPIFTQITTHDLTRIIDLVSPSAIFNLSQLTVVPYPTNTFLTNYHLSEIVYTTGITFAEVGNPIGSETSVETGGVDWFNCDKSQYCKSSQRETTLNKPLQGRLFKHFFDFFHVHLRFCHQVGLTPLGSRERVPCIFI